MSTKLNRDELIELVSKILDTNYSEEDRVKFLNLFEQNVPHPQASDLIFWPDHQGFEDDLTIKEIVDIALSYKPVQL